MRSIELFSGCGGLALGLARAGFHHLSMAERDRHASATLLANQFGRHAHGSPWPTPLADVREIAWSSPEFEEASLVAGGPPCQPFSIGGTSRGPDDARDMWPEAIRAVRETRPTAFLFENVRGILRPAFSGYVGWIRSHLSSPSVVRIPGESLEQHLDRLKSTSCPEYSVSVFKLDAADFGCAQRRHRVFFAGIRSDTGIIIQAPSPTHSRERLVWEQWVSGEYWRRHGLPMPAITTASAQDRRLAEKLMKSGQEPSGFAWRTCRDAFVGLGEPRPSQSMEGPADHVFQPGARSYPGHTGSYIDAPSKALKAGVHGVPGGENMLALPDGSVRYFTLREAARLQGFPDTYIFPGSWSESMRQLGNAVPVVLAETVGRCVADAVRLSQSALRQAA